MRKKLKEFLKSRFANRIDLSVNHTPGTSLSHSGEQLRPIIQDLNAQLDLKALFPVLRILAVGRSGCGKSTLIRLLTGDEGPAMSDGTAGEQDIAKEWMIPDDIAPLISCLRRTGDEGPVRSDGTAGEQDIAKEWMIHDHRPLLIIHDSNGIDFQGKEQLKAIEEFVSNQERMQKPIHLVWYIVSGIDRRLLDDCGLLRLLGSKKIPFVMVITHNDYEEIVKHVVTDEMLDRLLEGVENMESVKQHIIRVGNHVKVLENGQLERVKVDVEALQQLSRRTAELLDGPLKNTWISQQTVDIDNKMKACVRILERVMVMGYFTAPALALFITLSETEMFWTFWYITAAFCRIWKAPKNLRIALRNTLTIPEMSQQILVTLYVALLGYVGLAVPVAATVLTSGVAAGSIVACLTAFGIATAKAAMSARGIHAVVILGCIMYLKSHSGCGGNWDEQKSIDEYTALCKTFATSEHREGLIAAVKKMEHVTALIFKREDHLQTKLFEELVGTFAEMGTHLQ